LRLASALAKSRFKKFADAKEILGIKSHKEVTFLIIK
jgi:hypothetical protein